MNSNRPLKLSARQPGEDVETSRRFTPAFDANGLIPAIVTNRATGEIAMFAFMNAEALTRTLESGYAHFWSRSRCKLWKKGEDSGNLLRVVEIRTDCDQDVVWIIADIQGNGNACHTGERSCFYRSVEAANDTDEPFILAKSLFEKS